MIALSDKQNILYSEIILPIQYGEEAAKTSFTEKYAGGHWAQTELKSKIEKLNTNLGHRVQF